MPHEQSIGADGGSYEVPRREPRTPTALPDAFRPFPVSALPKPLGVYVASASRAMSCDPSFIGLPLLVAAASAIGTTRCVGIKPDWREPCILWGAIVGESGTSKSPALRAATEFCHDAEHDANTAHAQLLEKHQADMQRYARDVRKWKQGDSDDDPPREPAPPPRTRYVMHEATVEGVASLLADNPRGLLLLRDELAAWFKSFGQYKSGSQSSDAEAWIEMYGGGSIRVDRKNRDACLFVRRAAVSITGGIQPGVLKRVLTQDRLDSGMAARFLLAMPPRQTRRWNEHAIDADALRDTRAAFKRLFGLVGALSVEDEDHEPEVVRLSSGAQRLFVEHYDRHNSELDLLTEPLSAAWSKLEATPARLALVLHCVGGEQPGSDLDVPSEIAPDCMRAAIALNEWFKYETKRIYAFLSESDEQRLLRKVLDLLQRQEGEVTVRELQRAMPAAFPQADDARGYLSGLAADGLGQLVSVTRPTGGRPSQRFRLIDVDKTDKTPGFVNAGDSAADIATAQKPDSGGGLGANGGFVSSVNDDEAGGDAP